LARLERALGQFMLNLHTTEPWLRGDQSAVSLVRDSVMFGTDPAAEVCDDQFRTTNDLWLIPTAEVPLTNLVA